MKEINYKDMKFNPFRSAQIALIYFICNFSYHSCV